jgi:DNA helicase IV
MTKEAAKETINDSCSDKKKSSAFNFSDENIKEFASKIMHSFGSFLDERKEDIQETSDKCKKKIKENPFMATIGALAIGVALGIIFKNKS